MHVDEKAARAVQQKQICGFALGSGESGGHGEHVVQHSAWEGYARQGKVRGS